MGFLFQSKQIANIIIKDHVIRYVGIKDSNPLVVQRFRERYLPKGIVIEGKIQDRETLTLILEECVSDWGIKNKEVRFIIPDSFVVIRKTTIPADVEEDEISGFLYLELGASIHLPFEDPVIDYKKIGEEEKKKIVLMFAAPQEIALDYSSLLEDVSLKPIAADISPLCVYRLFDYFDKTTLEDHSLLIQFDLFSVNLSIFHEDLPVFMRHLNLNSSLDDWEIRPNRASTFAEFNWVKDRKELTLQLDDIAKEIEHVLSFYRYNVQHDKAEVSNILVSGDHPYLEHIISALNDRYELPIKTIDSLDKLPANYFLPLGLALKEVQ